MSEKKTFGKTKVGLIICAGLVVILAVSNVWFFTRVQSLQNQVSSLQTDKSGLEGQVVSLQGEFGELQSDYSKLNDSHITLNANYNELSFEFEELSSNYVNITKHFNFLQQDYTALNATYNVLLNDFDRLAEDYEVLTNNFNALSENYSSLITSYDLLSNSYDTLSGSHSTLLSIHQTLQEQYFALNALYQQLQTNYKSLENTTNILSSQYEMLLDLWNEPLDYVVTPTWDEVIAWLATDGTDNITYDPNKFLCGDFSIMLIQHAKAMHWRMLFTVLEFDYYEENPTGIEWHHGYHAHAFVSIFTTEGIVYFEPQSDFTWYLYYTGDPETHVEFSDWEFIDFGEDWFGHVFVQYYNRMGANVEPIEDSSGSIKVGVP